MVNVSIHAQRVSAQRKRKTNKTHPRKAAWVYSYVLEKLREGWSPEQISGRLELKNEKKIVHWETIYRWIYDSKLKDKRLWEYLPRKRKKRKKKSGRKTQRVRIPNRVSIHTRHKVVEKRKEFGHWEGDSIIGRQTKGKIIHT